MTDSLAGHSLGALSGARHQDPLLRALEFLHRCQLADGEFPTCASPTPSMRQNSRFDSSPFVTSLVVHSLSHVVHALAQDMVARAASFLRSEMEGPGLWRYWSSRNPRHKQLELDLDDTCCCSHALRRAWREAPDNVGVLLANRRGDGLFYTYIAPRVGSPPEVLNALAPLANGATIMRLAMAGMLHEIDPIVQANVLLWLGERQETQPVTEYLTGLLRARHTAARSHYYPDPLAVSYFVSRAYACGCAGLGEARDAIIGRVENRTSAGYGSALAMALAACTLRNAGCDAPVLKRTLDELLAAQRPDGSWPRSTFYTDQFSFYGSEALTTAMCVEALAQSVR